MTSREIRCFLISAFGEKPLLRKEIKMDVKHDFEQLLPELIVIIEGYSKYRRNKDGSSIEVLVERADMDTGGEITSKFYKKLFEYEIVVAEISAVSANVYYELGVRLALRRSGTILLAMQGTEVPFDIQTLDRVEYSPGRLKDKQNKIYEHIDNALNDKPDSPIHLYMPELHIVTQDQINAQRYAYEQQIAELQARFSKINMGADAAVLYKQAKSILDDKSTTREDLHRASDLLHKAQEMSKDNYEVALEYGKLLSEIEDHNEAIRILNVAVEIAKDLGNFKMAEAYRERGLAYRRRGSTNYSEKDFENAIRDLKKSLAADEANEDTWGRLGSLYRRQDRIAKALLCYQKGLKAKTDSTYCLVNELLLRVIAHRTKPENQSIDSLARSATLIERGYELLKDVSLESANYWRCINRAEVALLDNKPDEAITYYERASVIANTPAELRGAIDNLTFIRKLNLLPGTIEAISLLEEHYNRLSLS